MLLLEFSNNIKNDNIIIRYKNINDYIWEYLTIDFITLNLLIQNYSILSTNKYDNNKLYSSCDNPSTGKICELNYYGANIKIGCNSIIINNNILKQFLNKFEENF